jgi:selT/selW/selH-like putative selenoprotein
VFKRRATEVFNELCGLFADSQFKLVLNATTPRKGAFEISVAKSADTEKTLIWSGLKKGPPRKNKFPEVATLVKVLTKAIK